MKKLITVIMVFIFICLNSISSKAIVNQDIFNEIINISNAEIIEVGVETTFNGDEDVCIYYEKLKEVIAKLGYSKDKINANKENNYIEFNIENIYGTIEKIKFEEGIIKITLNQKTNDNNLEFLKSITKLTFLEEKHVNQYLHVKSSFNNQNCNLLNNKIVNFLDKSGATDFDTVPLKNGYSTICNTKRYEEKVSFQRKFDFQFAIMNYKKENYLIIGTPEITVAF
ncbi:MAG: hypothetical protein ACRCW0_01300 [Clostridium sp.]